MKLRNVGKMLIMALLLFLLNGISAFAFLEEESNDTMASATPISVNQRGSGNISTGEDVDYYRFTLSKQGSIQVLFNRDYVQSTSNGWNLEIQNSQGIALVGLEYRGGNTSEYKSMNIGLSAGTYYVKVTQDWNWTDVSYYFSIQYTASDDWETEFNDTFQSADTIKTNSKYYGSIKNSADEE